MNQNDFLCQYSRHVPRLLRRQLLMQLAERYLNSDTGNDVGCCIPSIQRFYGSLLFVDISGFTTLSQRLSVEELKNHINEYFTKILDIVDKHEGDVVKFAGDALFVVWESSSSSANKQNWADLSKILVEKAVECGKEISSTCSNYCVSLAERTIKYDELEPIAPSRGGPARLTPLELPNFFPSGEEECVYLNVHSGVSVGLMAGIDIGADNRWEYFLIGEPLSKVAEAESQASSGDMIMCPESHALLHGAPVTSSISMADAFSQLRSKFSKDNSQSNQSAAELPCGCTAMKNGYCKVPWSPGIVAEPSRKIRRRKTNISPKGDALHPILASIGRDVDAVREAFDDQFKKAFERSYISYRLMNPGGRRHGNGDLTEEVMQRAFCEWAETCLTDDIARHVHHVMRSEYVFSDISRQGAYERDFEKTAEAWSESKLSPMYQPRLLAPIPRSIAPIELEECSLVLPAHLARTRSLLQSSLEAPRPDRAGSSRSISPLPSPTVRSVAGGGESPFFPASRSSSPFAGLQLDSLQSVPSPLRPLSRLSGTESPSGDSVSSESQQSSMRGPTRKKANLLFTALSSPHTGAAAAVASQLNAANAELRNVTVMFVKINMTDAELLIDESGKKVESASQFVGTTAAEKEADERLLARYQKCIEVLSGALTSYGGQMRQFIVDDKGTVCIGTFGLRGSVSDDNAAAALDAANAIVLQLQSLGLQCSIGVTVGRAYCGLVGSSNRHEYAVMGPSTNLSARLMCKAPANGVICDAAIKMRDRGHKFSDLGDVIAKGYSAPVGTFRPIFREVDEDVLSSQQLSFSTFRRRGSAESIVLHHSDSAIIRRIIETPSSLKVVGRNEEILQVLSFAFAGLVASSAFAGGDQQTFHWTHPTRMVGLIGSTGMGKDFLVSSIAEQVVKVCKRTPRCNLQMFRTRYDRYNADASFSTWKPILIDLVCKIRSGYKSNVRQSNLTEAINFVIPLLPEECHQHASLLNLLLESRARHTHANKISVLVELAIAIIKLYVTVFKSVLFITMEKVHLLDKASSRLLQEVHSSCTGVIILFSCVGDCEIVAPFMNSDRYLELELLGLTKEAVGELIMPTLVMGGRQVDHQELCDRVFHLTAGNPLYAVEMTTSLLQKQGDVVPHNSRVEEVICHRFDQLSHAAQALLKTVSVICANKKPFTMGMLTRIEGWDLLDSSASFAYPSLGETEMDSEVLAWTQQHSDCAVKYALILSSILMKETFLRIVRGADGSQEDKTAFTLESLLSCDHAIEFSIPLEQTTIYNLLLVDQKRALHSATAKYFESCRSVCESWKHASEEGFHWEKARVWRKAMLCYHHASQCETDSLVRSNHLEKAFQSLLAMAGAEESVLQMGLSYSQLKSLFQEAMGGEKRNMEGSFVTGAAVTLEKTHEIFGGDSELLSAGITVLTSVALRRKHRFEDFTQTLLIVEDAMQMALLTKRPFLMSDRFVSMLLVQSFAGLGGVGGEEQQPSEEDMHFCLHSFWPVMFRIMSVYCMNYVLSVVSASGYSRKAAFVAEQFLFHARREGQLIDTIQALVVNALIQNKLSNLKGSLGFVEEVVELYEFATHSVQLIQSYGADHLIYVMTRTIKHLLLSGDHERVGGYVTKVIAWFHSLTHVASLTLSVLRLVSVLAYIDRIEDAQTLLTKYEGTVEGQHSNERVPPSILDLYRIWLRRRVDGEDRAWCKAWSQVEAVVASDDKLNLSPFMEYHRNEVVLILADLWSLKIGGISASHSESDRVKSCSVCCGYLQSVLISPTVDTHDLFCKARAVRICLRMLRVLSAGGSTLVHRAIGSVFSELMLNELLREAQINLLPVLGDDVAAVQHLLYR